jgi:hypothetical protein
MPTAITRTELRQRAICTKISIKQLKKQKEEDV